MIRLKVANLLPVRMFLQLLDLLHLSKICNEAWECDYCAFLEFCDLEQQRNKSELSALRPPKYQKSRASFFFRTQSCEQLTERSTFCISLDWKIDCWTSCIRKFGRSILKKTCARGKSAVIVRTAVLFGGSNCERGDVPYIKAQKQ